MSSTKKIKLPVNKLIAAILANSICIYLRGKRNEKKWLKRWASMDKRDYYRYSDAKEFLFLDNNLDKFIHYMELNISIDYIRKKVKQLARSKKKLLSFQRSYKYLRG